MQLTAPLRPGSRSGYTTIPNWLLDDLCAQGSDALALGVLLVRLIPGQTASIALTGEASRAALARTLGWGEKNWRRFQAAMESVCQTGGATYGLENRNTPVVTVMAELTPPPPHAVSAQGKGSAKAAEPAPAKSAGLTRTRMEKPEREKTLKKTPPPAREERGWLEEVFQAFAEAFASRPSPAERQAFADAVVETGATPDELLTTIARFGAHPYLAATTTSPMRLLHATAAEHAAARIDAAVREHLRAVAADFDRRGVPPPEVLDRLRNQVVHGVAVLHEQGGGGRIRQDVYLAGFDAYFATELAPLVRVEHPVPVDAAGGDVIEFGDIETEDFEAPPPPASPAPDEFIVEFSNGNQAEEDPPRLEARAPVKPEARTPSLTDMRELVQQLLERRPSTTTPPRNVA